MLLAFACAIFYINTKISYSEKSRITSLCFSCIRGDYLKVYWEVQGPGPPGAINERSAWARTLCGSRSDAPSALYSPGPGLVLEFHTGARQNNATGFVGTFSFIDKREKLHISHYFFDVIYLSIRSYHSDSRIEYSAQNGKHVE